MPRMHIEAERKNQFQCCPLPSAHMVMVKKQRENLREII